MTGFFVSLRAEINAPQTISEEKLSFPRRRESRKTLYFIRIATAILFHSLFMGKLWVN